MKTLNQIKQENFERIELLEQKSMKGGSMFDEPSDTPTEPSGGKERPFGVDTNPFNPPSGKDSYPSGDDRGGTDYGSVSNNPNNNGYITTEECPYAKP